MSNFAKEQLLKYGWTEGKGLGKNEDGMTNAIKPKLKFDTTGIGHKEDCSEWWQNSYNKTLSNIIVKDNSDENVTFEIDKSEETKNQSKLQSLLHLGKFVKTSTLHYGKLFTESKISTPLIDEKLCASTLTDEELFKVCGGRTAHKGARHGLNLNGKLSRLAEQDKLISLSKVSTIEPSNSISETLKEKKRKRHADIIDSDTCSESSANNSDLEKLIPNISQPQKDFEIKVSRKKKKQYRRKVEDISYQMKQSFHIDNSPKQSDSGNDINKIKRKLEDDLNSENGNVIKIKKKLKKKKRAKNGGLNYKLLEDSDEIMEPVDTTDTKKKYLKKKSDICTSFRKNDTKFLSFSTKQKYNCSNKADFLNHKINKAKTKKLKRQKKINPEASCKDETIDFQKDI